MFSYLQNVGADGTVYSPLNNKRNPLEPSRAHLNSPRALNVNHKYACIDHTIRCPSPPKHRRRV